MAEKYYEQPNPCFNSTAHPQIKAFVYHSGLNGLWEAVYHGVPMVAVPLCCDEYDNAQRMVSRGIGVTLDILQLTSDELAEAIRTVITDPRYLFLERDSLW